MELQPSSESVEVCLGTTFQVNCTTETDHLRWRTSPQCQVSYNKDDIDLVGDVIQRCDFEAILLSTSPSLLMSTVTLRNVNSSNNGTVLTCLNTIIALNLGTDQMASISILVRGNVHHQRAHIFVWMVSKCKRVCYTLKLDVLFLRSSLGSTQPFLYSTVPVFCGTFLDSQ